MKNIFFLCGLLATVLAFAEEDRRIYAYDYWARLEVTKYLDAVDRAAEESQLTKTLAGPECQNFAQQYTKDGLIDIRYGLGYFDDSTGEEVIWDNTNWGTSPSSDSGIFDALRTVLTGPCPNEMRRLCGFKEVTSEQERKQDAHTVLVREMEIQGKTVEVRFSMTYASASPRYEDNKTIFKDQQAHQTKVSEENFFAGLGEADVVFYNGHSRNGGGPDFHPPVLNEILHVDYKGYYQIQRPGIQRVTAEIKKGQRKDVLLGLFSCDSRLHFFNRLMNNNPKQAAILTANTPEITLNYFDTLKASTGYLEGFLRGGCGSRLDQFAKVEDKLQKTFFSYHLK